MHLFDMIGRLSFIHCLFQYLYTFLSILFLVKVLVCLGVSNKGSLDPFILGNRNNGNKIL